MRNRNELKWYELNEQFKQVNNAIEHLADGSPAYQYRNVLQICMTCIYDNYIKSDGFWRKLFISNWYLFQERKWLYELLETLLQSIQTTEIEAVHNWVKTLAKIEWECEHERAQPERGESSEKLFTLITRLINILNRTGNEDIFKCFREAQELQGPEAARNIQKQIGPARQRAETAEKERDIARADQRKAEGERNQAIKEHADLRRELERLRDQMTRLEPLVTELIQLRTEIAQLKALQADHPVPAPGLFHS